MKRVSLTLLIIILPFVNLFPQTLNLEQARLLALASSRSLARYELALRSSILDEKNQLYTMLPSVSAGYSATMNYLRDWEFVNPVDTFSAGATLSVTQIIFEGGKSFIQKAIAGIATESVRNDALAEYFNVLDSVDNAYYAVLEAQATLEAEEASLEAVGLSLSIAGIRHASGMINLGDYLKALSDMEARQNSRDQARRNLALANARLRTITGIEQAAMSIELEQIDFSIYEDILIHLAAISDEYVAAIFEGFWRQLLSSNLSLARSALSSERAEHNLSLTRRDYAPTISATVFSTGLGYSTANGFDHTSSGGLTIRGTIPIDFWVMNNRIEKSRLARDSAALDYANAEISLEIELQSVLLSIFAQAGSVLSTRRSLEYTEKHFEYVMERYRLLQSSISDLSEATSLFINTRNNHIRASYGFLQSLARLRSMGALDDEQRLLELLMGN